ncbi:unannotated protein [freshwater metagenome]|uniref:Unannotated protein n=1 Tax=freshwater metagenome TaxID=449393 RepID=A0A6J6L8A4_9ZZZZ
MFAPTTATNAARVKIPQYILMIATISDALIEYSAQRKRLIPFLRSLSYVFRANVDVSR